MMINRYIKTALFISLGFTIEASAAVVIKDTSVNSKPSYKSSKIYVDGLNIGYFRKGEKIQVLEVIKNREGTWYKTPRGYVKKKYLRYNPKTENLSDYVKVIPKYPIKYEIQKLKTKIAKVEKVLLSKPIKKEEKPKKIVIIKKEPLQKTSEEKKSTEYFLGFDLNSNRVNIDKNDKAGSIILNDSLDESGISFNIHLGRRFSNYLLAANYERTNLDDVKIDSYYLSLDYEFTHKYRPFIGVLLGKSDLTWKIDPLVNSQTKDKKLSSYIYGLQAGINYPINKEWIFFSKARYEKFDLKTKLISVPTESEIIYKNRSSLGIGIRYFFNLD